MKGSDGRIENPKVGHDVPGSHVYRAWGEMCAPHTTFSSADLLPIFTC